MKPDNALSGVPERTGMIAIEKAAVQFGKGTPTIIPLGNGLINRTYKVDFTDSHPIVLQCINQSTFPQPENIINNYRLIQDYAVKTGGNKISSLLPTSHGKYYWIDAEGNFWRATEFIGNSYASAIPENTGQVFTAAKSFAAFTQSLNGLKAEELAIIIPNFHNLAFRYKQFEDTVKKAHISRLLKSTHVISEIRDRITLVDFYNEIENNESDYPTRIMHHDCKISNILFDASTRAVICPVDLDTVMPGKYFSDIGDMIRTMACTEEENSTAWELIDVKADYYTAIINGYTEGMGKDLTAAEKQHIHQPGLLLTYMQCLRFVTDFLNNDIYYKTTYPEQNLNRALNQLILLEKLEEYISKL
ncbi:MAG: phosphotransferase [Chitinophagaceae bacterium]